MPTWNVSTKEFWLRLASSSVLKGAGNDVLWCWWDGSQEKHWQTKTKKLNYRKGRGAQGSWHFHCFSVQNGQHTERGVWGCVVLCPLGHGLLLKTMHCTQTSSIWWSLSQKQWYILNKEEGCSLAERMVTTSSLHCLNSVPLFSTGNQNTMLSHSATVKQRKQQASAITKEIHGNGTTRTSSWS